MRYVSRRHDIKAAYNEASGSKSGLMTVAIKQNLKLCERLHNFGIDDPVVAGQLDKTAYSEKIFSTIPVNVIENF